MRIGIDKIIAYLLLFKRTWKVYEISLKTFQVNLSTKQFIWGGKGFTIRRSVWEQGSAWFKIWLVTGYHWLPEFGSQGGYRLPLVTRILVSGLLPVTTGYQNFGLRWCTSLPHLSRLPVTSGYQKINSVAFGH